MTAIQAAFVDLRTVKTRSTMQLIFEVPLEAADKALAALGGVPIPGSDRWVGIARLVAPEARSEPAEPHKDLARSMAGKARYAAQGAGDQAVTRAVLLAKDKRFQDWLVETGRSFQASEVVAASYIRDACGCEKSRREIATDPEKMRLFEALETSFSLWRDGWSA